jgi:hypothetical protein
VIIGAWTRDNHITGKREVERILDYYKLKMKCFEDVNGKKTRHPRDLGEDWSLSENEFDLFKCNTSDILYFVEI